MAALNVKFYHAENLLIGGSIDTSNLVGSLIETGSQAAPVGDISDSLTSEDEGGSDTDFYRKLWVKNHGSAVDSPRLYVGMQTYPGQVSIALEKVADDTSADNYTMPPGYSEGDFESPNSIADAVYLFPNSSDLEADETASFWVRIRVPAGMDSDDAAGFRINLFGRPV
jgi:hypothetical protein